MCQSSLSKQITMVNQCENIYSNFDYLLNGNLNNFLIFGDSLDVKSK